MSSLFDIKGESVCESMDADQLAQHSEVLFLKESCRRSLLGNLKEIASSPVVQLRKLVIWPLVIAGIESEHDEDGSRSFIASELKWISRALGTASPLVAQDFLSRLWRRFQAAAGLWNQQWMG